MEKLTDLQYLKLNKLQRIWYHIVMFFASIPRRFAKLGIKIWHLIKRFGLYVKDEVLDIVHTFTKGNWAIKLSFIVMGLGNIVNGQIMRGVLFLLFEVVFILYMIVPSGGIYWLGKGQWFQTGSTVGTVKGEWGYDYELDVPVKIPGDDSVRVMLYGLLTIVFIIALIYTWRLQLRQCSTILKIKAQGKKVKSGKDDLKSLLDDQFHKTMLGLPVLGITMFTVLPIIFMILVAFTSYDAHADGYNNLFSWVGLDNFNQLTNVGKGGLGIAFGELLGWTLMWSFFATFTNYFLGMAVAILINKKGIKIKKFWRTILVMTIAIPQFVSLLYVARLFDSTGVIGKVIQNIFNKPQNYSLWGQGNTARALLIIINIWIGIPYVMLQATGILMNIPADLYESSKIDGANVWQQFTKITLPYMLFVTGPSLLTSFVSNLNNFNVIYLLSGGNPQNTDVGTVAGTSIGETDLLITWLFKVTTGVETDYKTASVLGILIFVVVAALSLIVYNVIPSTRNEEDFR